MTNLITNAVVVLSNPPPTESSNDVVVALLTIFGTVLSGIVVLLLGELFMSILVKPAQEIRRLIGEIAYYLGFYANRFGSDPLPADVSEKFRDLAFKLRGALEMIPRSCHRGVARLKLLPPRQDIEEASRELVGLSNYNPSSRATDPFSQRRTAISNCSRSRSIENRSRRGLIVRVSLVQTASQHGRPSHQRRHQLAARGTENLHARGRIESVLVLRFGGEG